MARPSIHTKKVKRKLLICEILHFLFLFGPFLYFIPYAYITSGLHEKIILSLDVIVCIILAIISGISSLTHQGNLHKSIFWIGIIGIIFCLDSVRAFCYIMAIASIIDELILLRLIKKYEIKKETNTALDERL